MAFLTGPFVGKDGLPTAYDRIPVEVTHDGDRIHFRIDGSGKGTMAVDGCSAEGTFTTLGGRAFRMNASIDGSRWNYVLSDGSRSVAEGILLL